VAGPTVYVRQNIWSLDPTTAFSSPVTLNYAKAVGVMKRRPATDPTSWAYQANIHGTPDPAPPGADWNQCQHGTWFFLPWHRMYIYFFEKIVRAAVKEAGGDPTGWALPYWNYSDGPAPIVTSLPLALRAKTLPDGSPNPLYLAYPNRNANSPNDRSQGLGLIGAGINDGGQIPPRYVTYAQAFVYRNFSYPPAPDPGFGGPRTGFSHQGSNHGELERQPHDNVHVFVGGASATVCDDGWMTDPDCAARDAVFWLHHSNIDRLWKRWLLRSGHANATAGTWLNQSYRFYDPDKSAFVNMAVRDVLQTVSQLGYRYDDDPPPVARPVRIPQALVAEAAAPVEAPAVSPRTLVGSTGPVVVAAPVGSAAGTLSGQGPELGQLIASDPARAPHINLNLVNVERDEDAARVFDLYLNLPDQQQPDPTSVYFVGHATFFGHGGHQHPPAEGEAPPAGTTFSYDITNLVNEQEAQGVWDPKGFHVTFVVGGHHGEEGAPSLAAAAGADQTGALRIGDVTITTE